MMITQKRQPGFTLMEMMVASVVTSFIILVAVSGLAGTASSRSRIEEATLAADELRYAMDSLQQDLRNVYRDTQQKVFEGMIEETGTPRIRFRAIRHVNARDFQPESDLYEVEYFVVQDDETLYLARRVCPVVGVETDPEETNGGILTKLTDAIAYFSIRYFDGSQWLDQWLLEEQTMPMLIEISVAVRSGQSVDSEEDLKRQVQIKQILVNFPRSGDDQTLTTDQMELEESEDMTEEMLTAE
ncbi:MAG: type II secretion system protein GspJ [Planctomycetota bacterium]|jgi:prepilin-type N-terminal cleavage/methylation domain-containing protein